MSERKRLSSYDNAEYRSHKFDKPSGNACYNNTRINESAPITIKQKRRIRDFDNAVYRSNSLDIPSSENYNDEWFTSPPIDIKPKKVRMRDPPLHVLSPSPVPEKLFYLTIMNTK